MKLDSIYAVLESHARVNFTAEALRHGGEELRPAAAPAPIGPPRPAVRAPLERAAVATPTLVGMPIPGEGRP